MVVYSDVITSAMACQITGMPTVSSNFCSGVRQTKPPSSALLALCEGNPPVVTRKMFPSDDVIMLMGHPDFWHHDVMTCHGNAIRSTGPLFTKR